MTPRDIDRGTGAEAFSARLRMAMKIRGLTSPAELARYLKVKPQTAYKWWAGQTKHLRVSDFFHIVDRLDVSSRWLYDGTGPMTRGQRLTADEKSVLAVFSAMPAGWRNDWLRQGHMILERLGHPSSAVKPYKTIDTGQ